MSRTKNEFIKQREDEILLSIDDQDYQYHLQKEYLFNNSKTNKHGKIKNEKRKVQK